MPLMSTSSQPGPILGTSTKIAAQGESVQKPASRMDKGEQAADNDFESLLEKEQPQNKETAEAQPSEKTETNGAEAEKPTEANNSEKTQQPENSDKSEENSSEENQEQIAEFSDFVEAQANWKPEGNPAPQVSETATQTIAVINKPLADEAQKALQQLTQDALNNGQAAKTSQSPVGFNTSLLAQKVTQEGDRPEQFKQDSLSEHIDLEETLLSNAKTESQGTKTNLDIQQLVARLNTPQVSGSAETTQATYSQVAASAQSAQVAPTATGQAQAPVPQAHQETQPALSMFSDPDWPEDLGQRMFRLSQGDNGIKEVSLRLDPPSLGTLDIRLKIDENSISVQFQSASPQVREMLQNQADRLRANLSDSNMNLVDVDVSSGHDQRGQHASEQSETWQEGSMLTGLSSESAHGEEPVESDQQESQTNSVSNNLFFSTYA